jgi:hypothetical protein
MVKTFKKSKSRTKGRNSYGSRKSKMIDLNNLDNMIKGINIFYKHNKKELNRVFNTKEVKGFRSKLLNKTNSHSGGNGSDDLPLIGPEPLPIDEDVNVFILIMMGAIIYLTLNIAWCINECYATRNIGNLRRGTVEHTRMVLRVNDLNRNLRNWSDFMGLLIQDIILGNNN